MNVPLLDLKLQYNSLKNELENAIIRVAESQSLILGEEVRKLENNIAEYTNCRFAIGVSSGTDALLMALMSLNLKPEDEVILPDYSFFATAGVVARLGAKPIFIDCDPATFNINPDKIIEKINSKTKAIIPVHLFGQSADLDSIMNISKEYDIPIIEDCAQAIGTEFINSKKVGSFGICGCFSFYPTKNLGAFGDGGMITTNDEKLYNKFIQMRNHGMEPKYHHKFIGGNFRLDAIQAAVLNVKFEHLEKWNQKRRDNAELYNELFIGKKLTDATSNFEFNSKNSVILPKAIYKENNIKNYHTYNQYVIKIEKRDKLKVYLSENGIGSEIYYPIPFHKQECFKYLYNSNIVNSENEFFQSNFNANHSLAIPIFPELSKEQIIYVVDKIQEFIVNY